MKELSLLLLELLRNSLEAGAARVDIRVREIGDSLTWRIADDGRGMTRQECKEALNPFFTKRTTRAVGLGLGLLDMWTRHCGGKVRMISRPGLGTMLCASFGRSHPDLPPWGDLPGTLWTLAVTMPQIHFQYLHYRDGRQWQWDSSTTTGLDMLTLKEVLETGWSALKEEEQA
ncbi:ATP-binding protein [uncultured Anaeromusa sp.]|uniref:ATP-binding protein n=1 Tax=uncultured Anaeromusa sp. TaxID=673273 RepID=UPI0029C6E447|nr:ATP-binding protein [uncultured Anaeromusa sp.]